MSRLRRRSHRASTARTGSALKSGRLCENGTYAIGYPLANARQSGGSPAGDRWQWQRPFAA